MSGMEHAKLKKPRGILYPRPAHDKFQLALHEPSLAMAQFVEHYWIVSWDLPGNESYCQETLPHPCVHLVVERGRSRIVGVKTGKFSQVLRGSGLVFGIKWRPGAFYPFVQLPVSRFTNRETAVSSIFGAAGERLERHIFAAGGETAMSAAAELFLAELAPRRDDRYALLTTIVEHIAADRETTTVEGVAQQFAISVRTYSACSAPMLASAPSG